MKLDARQRWAVLGGLLTATLAAAAWVHDRDNSEIVVVGAAEPRRAPRTGESAGNVPSQRLAEQRSRDVADAESVPKVQLDKLDSRSIGEASKDPFAVPRPKVKKQVVRKPPPVLVDRTPPPPPPSAPPLPFKYMGKLVDGGEVSVFLTHGSRNLVVHAGDTIDSKYRVDQIADSKMTLTYLPLQERQTLKFGERE